VLKSMVEALETASTTAVCGLEVLPATERHRVLYEWNDTQSDFPADKCVHQLFEEQVEKTPDAVAVVFEEQQLSQLADQRPKHWRVGLHTAQKGLLVADQRVLRDDDVGHVISTIAYATFCKRLARSRPAVAGGAALDQDAI